MLKTFFLTIIYRCFVPLSFQFTRWPPTVVVHAALAPVQIARQGLVRADSNLTPGTGTRQRRTPSAKNRAAADIHLAGPTTGACLAVRTTVPLATSQGRRPPYIQISCLPLHQRMSFRTSRTQALPPHAAQQMVAEEQSGQLALKSAVTPHQLPSIILPASNEKLTTSSLQTPTLSSSFLSPQTPSSVGFMTERQQLAYLMRATSEPDESSKMNTTKDESDEEGEDESEVEDDDEEEESDSSPATPAPVSHSSKSKQPSSSPTPSSSGAVSTAIENDLYPRAIRQPIQYAVWEKDQQKRWDQIGKNPNLYYLHHLPPGIAPAPGTKWSDKERTMFAFALENYPPEGAWGLFSMNIPGRTGLECDAYFKTLVKEGLASETKATKKQPARVSLEGKLRKMKFETTPMLVARPVSQLGTDNSARLLELATAIASLSLAPYPGTAHLKMQVSFRTEKSQAAAFAEKVREKKERAEKEKEEERERLEKEREKSAKKDRSNAVATSAASGQIPSTPSTSFSRKKEARAWGSGGIGSGSAGDTPSSGSRRSIVSARASEALESSMVQLKEKLEKERGQGKDVDMRDISSSPKPQTPSTIPHKHSKKHHRSSSPTPAATEEEEAQEQARLEKERRMRPEEDDVAREIYKQAPKMELVGMKPASFGGLTTPSSKTSTAAAIPSSSILPFPAFTVPAHTPYAAVSVAKRRKTAEINAAPSSPSASRFRSTPPIPFQSLPPHIPHPVPFQALPYPAARFDADEIRLDLEIDRAGKVRMREQGSWREVKRANDAAPVAAAAAVHSSTDGDTSMTDISPSSPFQSYTSELTALEASFRVKLKRLAAFQATQLARARMAYGVPARRPEEESSAMVDEGQYYAYTRISDASVTAAAGAFGQPRNTFATGCKAMLDSYFNHSNTSAAASATSPSSPSSTSADALPSLLSRCRTYGDAFLQIKLNYKSLLKELQREHATGRDVLNSLRIAGLLQ